MGKSSIFQNRENLKMSEANKKAKQNPSGTRQRGALAIRPTKAQLLRNEKIRKNQEAKRPLTELKTPQKEKEKESKKYLTQEEYKEQGKRETDLALVNLRDQINSSPEPMKILKSLRPETRNLIIEGKFNYRGAEADSEDLDPMMSDLDLKSQSDEEDVDSSDGEPTRNAF